MRKIPIRHLRRGRPGHRDRQSERPRSNKCEAAGRISLGLFFAETNGNQNIGNARSNTYKGSLQTGTRKTASGKRNGLQLEIQSPRSIRTDRAGR
jgi:hypothetical protein